MPELIDWFGKDFRILEESEDTIKIKLQINESSMRYWVLQYGPYVEVLEPENFREQIKADVKEMYEKYFGQK